MAPLLINFEFSEDGNFFIPASFRPPIKKEERPVWSLLHSKFKTFTLDIYFCEKNPRFVHDLTEDSVPELAMNVSKNGGEDYA